MTFLPTGAVTRTCTPVDAYPRKGRGGKGVIGIRITEQRGHVAAAFLVHDGDEAFLVASGGTIIRIAVDDVSVQGRAATGVRVMNLDDGQYVAAVALVQERDDEHATTAVPGDPAPDDGTVLTDDALDDADADDIDDALDNVDDIDVDDADEVVDEETEQ